MCRKCLACWTIHDKINLISEITWCWLCEALVDWSTFVTEYDLRDLGWKCLLVKFDNDKNDVENRKRFFWAEFVWWLLLMWLWLLFVLCWLWFGWCSSDDWSNAHRFIELPMKFFRNGKRNIRIYNFKMNSRIRLTHDNLIYVFRFDYYYLYYLCISVSSMASNYYIPNL